MAEEQPEKKPAPKVEPKMDYRHLVRVAATDLDGKKHLMYALTKIKGIKHMYANAICTAAGISKRKKTGDLTESEVAALEKVIANPAQFSLPIWLFNRRSDPETGEDKHLITSDLGFAKDMDMKLMKKTKSYKGLRHQWGLPVRGQRTKSNFRRNKGKSMGVQRKKTAPGRK
ncbi:MAG: 30S ribosomal protein S13 [Nanoarchaeota archaeon]